MSGQRGQNKTGGSRPTPRPYRKEEEDWKTTLKEQQRARKEGERVPHNVIQKPIQLPPMVRIKEQ